MAKERFETRAPEQAELLLFGGADRDDVRREIERARAGERIAPRGDAPLRAAAVVAGPDDLARALDELDSLLDAGDPQPLRAGRGAYAGVGRARVGFLFPGQGAPVHSSAGAIGELMPEAAAAVDRAGLPQGELPDERVQLAVVALSVAALRALEALGVEADLVLGHSLGELTALHWAGALDEPSLLRTAQARGDAMVLHSGGGAMASVIGDDAALERLLHGAEVSVACFNSPRQHAVSGTDDAIRDLVANARAAGARAIPLKVTGAFHSPLMSTAVPVFERHLAEVSFAPLERTVVSSVTGAELDPAADLRDLLARQIVDPVLFAQAAQEASSRVDLMLEVGPGKILAGLVGEVSDVPCVSMRAGDASPRGALEAVAAAWAAGAAPHAARLLEQAEPARA